MTRRRWIDHPAQKALRDHLDAYPPETDDERAARVERIFRAVMASIDAREQASDPSIAPEVPYPCVPHLETPTPPALSATPCGEWSSSEDSLRYESDPRAPTTTPPATSSRWTSLAVRMRILWRLTRRRKR